MGLGRKAWRLLVLAGFLVGLALVVVGIWEILRGCSGSGFFLLGVAALPVGVGSGSRRVTGIASLAFFALSTYAFTVSGSC